MFQPIPVLITLIGLRYLYLPFLGFMYGYRRYEFFLLPLIVAVFFAGKGVCGGGGEVRSILLITLFFVWVFSALSASSNYVEISKVAATFRQKSLALTLAVLVFVSTWTFLFLFCIS